MCGNVLVVGAHDPGILRLSLVSVSSGCGVGTQKLLVDSLDLIFSLIN